MTRTERKNIKWEYKSILRDKSMYFRYTAGSPKLEGEARQERPAINAVCKSLPFECFRQSPPRHVGLHHRVAFRDHALHDRLDAVHRRASARGGRAARPLAAEHHRFGLRLVSPFRLRVADVWEPQYFAGDRAARVAAFRAELRHLEPQGVALWVIDFVRRELRRLLDRLHDHLLHLVLDGRDGRAGEIRDEDLFGLNAVVGIYIYRRHDLSSAE